MAAKKKTDSNRQYGNNKKITTIGCGKYSRIRKKKKNSTKKPYRGQGK